MEEEGSRFKEAILKVKVELCGIRRIRKGMRRKRSEWWSDGERIGHVSDLVVK